MIEIIPAIDLLKGKCVRLIQGKYDKVTEFNPNPVDQALIWEGMGASRLHIVDLDGAKTGLPINNEVIKSIRDEIKIPIQIGGGIRTIERAEELLGMGINKIIMGTSALENTKTVLSLSAKHPKRIIIGIDTKDGKVATRGWVNNSQTSAFELIQTFADCEIAAFICTDISTDGTLKGPNLDYLREIASFTNVPVIASGGVGSIADIISLIPLINLGVCGVIVGRALYDGAFDLKEAIKVSTKLDLQDLETKSDLA